MITEVQERPDKRMPKLSESKASAGVMGRVGLAIDSLAMALAPSWGVKRVSSRYKRQLLDQQIALYDRLGYSWPGAAPAVYRDGRFLGTKASPDEAIEHDLPELRSRCVELYRGNTIAHAAVEGRVSYEIGTGMTRQPRVREDRGITKDQANLINDRLKEVCDRWSAHGCDKRRRLSLPAVQRLVCRTFAMYGEAFIVVGQAPFRGSIGMTLDVISPERVETPPEFRNDDTVRMGVKYDAQGQILGYYVRASHPDQVRGFRYSYDFISRFDATGHVRMIHVFDPQFPDQSRGIPWLANALARAKDVDDFFEAELIAKQIEACFGLIVEGGTDSASPHDVAEGNAKRVASNGTRLEEIKPGMIQYVEEGQTVKTVDPNRPGASFAPFIELSLRSIAASINFPYELLAKNFFRTTFSSGRLAMLDGWMGFSARQQVIVDQFLAPVWRRLVHDAVFSGEMEELVPLIDYIDRPHVYERHRWASQARGFLDPTKEVGAHVDALDAGITTKSDIFAEKGQDWEDAEEQLDVEERKRIELRIAREVYERELRQLYGLPEPQAEQPTTQQRDRNIEDDPEDADVEDGVLT